MGLSFAEHLDLLEQQGRSAVTGLESLGPDDTLPPSGDSVLKAATEHWSTLEIWSWSLSHPGEHWSERKDPAPPGDYRALVVGIEDERARLVALLRDAGPDLRIDYFGRPGTTTDVARLLAFEAATVARNANLASGRPSLPLLPAAASDGVGQALGHWSSARQDIVWRPRPVSIRATDTGEVWHLSLPEVDDDLVGEFRLASPRTPAAVVEGPAEKVLWWLHGHAEPMVSVTGDTADVRAVKSAFLHPVEKAPRPKRRWFG